MEEGGGGGLVSHPFPARAPRLQAPGRAVPTEGNPTGPGGEPQSAEGGHSESIREAVLAGAGMLPAGGWGLWGFREGAPAPPPSHLQGHELGFPWVDDSPLYHSRPPHPTPQAKPLSSWQGFQRGLCSPKLPRGGWGGQVSTIRHGRGTGPRSDSRGPPSHHRTEWKPQRTDYEAGKSPIPGAPSHKPASPSGSSPAHLQPQGRDPWEGTKPRPRARGGHRPDVGVAPDECLQVPLDIIFVGLAQDVSHAGDRLVQPRGLRALRRQGAEAVGLAASP